MLYVCVWGGGVTYSIASLSRIHVPYLASCLYTPNHRIDLRTYWTSIETQRHLNWIHELDACLAGIATMPDSLPCFHYLYFLQLPPHGGVELGSLENTPKSTRSPTP